MAKKTKEPDQSTQEWHDSVIDDTPDTKFVPKSKKVVTKEEVIAKDEITPIFEDPAAYVSGIDRSKLPQCQWTDDWTELSEVTKINKELRGYGNNKRFVNVYYGPLKQE